MLADHMSSRDVKCYRAMEGPGVAQWLRHCATSRTVPRSNLGGVGRRDFSRGYRQNHLKMSTRDFSWGKGGWCVRLTTFQPCSAECQVFRGLNLPGPLGPSRRPVVGDLYLFLP
jgi:hypothetical protein